MLRRTVNRHGRGALLGCQRQHAACRTVKQTLVNPAACKDAQNVVSAAAVAGRHLEVKPGFQRGNAVVDGIPVAHDHALKAPLPPEQVVEQPAALGGVPAVNAVVGFHDRLGLGSLNGNLKGTQICLVQRAGGNIGGNRKAAGLLVVDGKVLDAAAHAVLLHGADVRGGKAACKVRVFREVLEVSAAERRTLHVHAGAEDNGDTLCNGILRNRVCRVRGNRTVPGGGKRGGGRHAGRRIRRPLAVLHHHLAQTVRSVGHHRTGNAEALDAVRVPGTLAVTQISLFRGCHFV